MLRLHSTLAPDGFRVSKKGVIQCSSEVDGRG